MPHTVANSGPKPLYRKHGTDPLKSKLTWSSSRCKIPNGRGDDRLSPDLSRLVKVSQLPRADYGIQYLSRASRPATFSVHPMLAPEFPLGFSAERIRLARMGRRTTASKCTFYQRNIFTRVLFHLPGGLECRSASLYGLCSCLPSR